MIGGLEFVVVSAQKQARTPRDVPIGWVRPKVPSKAAGRLGTRKAWKRAHPPHMRFAYREPTDVLVVGRRVIMTERQYHALREHPEVRTLDRSRNPLWGWSR